MKCNLRTTAQNRIGIVSLIDNSAFYHQAFDFYLCLVEKFDFGVCLLTERQSNTSPVMWSGIVPPFLSETVIADLQGRREKSVFLNFWTVLLSGHFGSPLA